MLGLMRLQERSAMSFGPPGAARHLMQELERALGGARIAVAQAQVGVDHADQIEAREMVALGDELRADDDVEAAFGDRVEFLPQPLDRFDQIARQHHDARVGKQRRHLLLQTLDAGTDGDKGIRRAAFRADGRTRRRKAAMMTDELTPEPMVDQPGIAVRALQAKAAGAAQRQRRIAAPVEEQERLLLARQRLGHRFGQARRDEAATRRPFAGEVDRLDHRQMLAAEALRQVRAPGSGRAGRSTSLSTEGVAEASTIGIAAARARTTAMSRA